MERRGGMETILCTTPLGRKRTVRAKLLVSAVVAVGIAATSCLPHLIQVLRDYGLPAMFASATYFRPYSPVLWPIASPHS